MSDSDPPTCMDCVSHVVCRFFDPRDIFSICSEIYYIQKEAD